VLQRRETKKKEILFEGEVAASVYLAEILPANFCVKVAHDVIATSHTTLPR
jgi:hypothetical protein